MNLDHARCYTAIAHDDAQFDGQFFTTVLTTGIYCRPMCRSRTPRPENVRFFATAAAAAEAGFRPCLRCRPESAPDAPAGPEVSPIVSRALRLIAEGVLDEMGVEDLARCLHLSLRQLRRYFVRELGAPPVAIAQTRRLLFAKKLLDETTLPMADVALSAGYASIRRFNEALRQTGRTLWRAPLHRERSEPLTSLSSAAHTRHRVPHRHWVHAKPGGDDSDRGSGGRQWALGAWGGRQPRRSHRPVYGLSWHWGVGGPDAGHACPGRAGCLSR
jgi:AraC family transcriptional regulator of adaptative response / DNA-3-methyladenine glycosylase II